MPVEYADYYEDGGDGEVEEEESQSISVQLSAIQTVYCCM